MIDILGWISTLLVLAGFVANAYAFRGTAMVTWIIGDIGWIIYDFYIHNVSHMVLSFIIISINIYGMYRRKKV